MIFSGEDKELDAIKFGEKIANDTGQPHSVVAISSTELTVILAADAGARALETIRPINRRY